VIVTGLALKKSQIGALTSGWITVIVRAQVTWALLAPVPVRVYVVVSSGETEVDPSTATLPTPLLIEAAVTFVVPHESVEL
jgi:hypothetical protein